MFRTVVVGGGQAGAAVVAKMRTLGHEGDVTLICGEPVPPYQRPPLSKAYLLGDMEQERLYLRPPQYYVDQKIDLRLGCHVDAIDPVAREVRICDEALAYDDLVLATGAHPRAWPDKLGGALAGIHVIRTLADVDDVASEAGPGKRLLVVGGGYIGLEAAAVARKLGMEVTLVEMAGRILQRVAASETSAYFRTLHQDHGVDIREGTGVDIFIGDGRVEAAQLSDGSRLEIDLAIIGIGVSPNDQLAAQAGLSMEYGIAVDAQGRTSDPHIWAAGDCVSLPYRGTRVRLESVQNAIDQAEAVATNIMGVEEDYVPMPWFWSDQYDVKLQIAGLNLGYDSVVTRDADALSHWYYRGGQFLAVDAMSDPRAYMIGKRLLEAGSSPDPAQIADPAFDLKTLLRK